MAPREREQEGGYQQHRIPTISRRFDVTPERATELDTLRRLRFQRQLRVERREFQAGMRVAEESARRRRVIEEHERRTRERERLLSGDWLQLNNDLLNFEIREEPQPTPEIQTTLMAPPPLQRQEARVMPRQQNQQNIHNQQNQPPPARFL